MIWLLSCVGHVPMPDVRSDVCDCVETYAVHMPLACRLKITLKLNLKLIINFHLGFTTLRPLLCNFRHPRIHRKHRKHTSKKYMSVCLTSVSCQQKKNAPAARDKLSPTSMCFLVQKKHLSKILWRFRNITTLFNGYWRIEKIIVSLSLSNLFSPNSNSFPTNSNIAETATV